MSNEQAYISNQDTTFNLKPQGNEFIGLSTYILVILLIFIPCVYEGGH